MPDLKSHFSARKAAEKVLELQKEISQYHPIDLIAAIAYSTIMFDREAYQETIHQGSQASTEYLITLCLKQGDPQQVRNNISEAAVAKTNHDLEEILSIRVMGSALSHRDPGSSALINQYYLRNRENYFHTFDLLQALFCEPRISETLLCELGFSGQTALRCTAFIGSLLETKLAGFHDEENRKSRKKKTHRFHSHLLADAFLFAPGELAAASSCPSTEVTNFLTAVSMRFGDVPRSFVLPEPTYLFAQRPIIYWDERYICPIPDLLMSSLRSRIETELKQRNAKAWEIYQQYRGELLVKETKQLFKMILPRCSAYPEMEYFIPSADGHRLRYECDLLVTFDRYILLIEAKAGNFSDAARRGKSRDLRADLQGLIGDPYDQLIRTREFIFSSDVVEFTGPDKSITRIRSSEYKAIFLISVTLDDLNAYTTSLHKLLEGGLLVGPYLPWAVNFITFRAISELLEFPSQFIDYLQRRLRLEDLKKFQAAEELDYFGHYIHEGLHFDGRHEEFNFVGLDTYTDEIDEYFFRLYRDTSGKARKPVQPMPSLFRQALQDLENRGDSGYVDVSIALLQMSTKARNKFSELLNQARAMSIADREIHDVRLMTKDKQGICIMTGPEASSLEIEYRFPRFCLLKKYENRSDHWVGVISLVGKKGIVHGFVLLDFPWKFDIEMERSMPCARITSPFSRFPG